jgi:rubrerythrin
MSKPLAGTQTEKNLAASFAGESMARNRYTFFSSIAKKQGYEQIGAFFLESAENEREHAKRFLKFLKAGASPGIKIELEIPSFSVGSTLENLRFSAEGEHGEHSAAYPEFAAVADQEGFPDIAAAYRAIAEVEAAHERRYRILAQQVETGTVFKRDREVTWKCRNCGYTVKALEAPKECPACGHAQGWYEVQEVLE